MATPDTPTACDVAPGRTQTARMGRKPSPPLIDRLTSVEALAETTARRHTDTSEYVGKLSGRIDDIVTWAGRVNNLVNQLGLTADAVAEGHLVVADRRGQEVVDCISEGISKFRARAEAERQQRLLAAQTRADAIKSERDAQADDQDAA